VVGKYRRGHWHECAFRSHRTASLFFSVLSKTSFHRSISILSRLLVEYGDNPRLKVTFLCGHGYPHLQRPCALLSRHAAHSDGALRKLEAELVQMRGPARPTRRWLIRTTQDFDLVNALPEGAWAVVNHQISHAAMSVFSIDSDICELVVAFIPTIQHLL
jgi:hypothetical protein